MFVFGCVQRLASVLRAASYAGLTQTFAAWLGAFIAPLQVEICSAVAVDHAIGAPHEKLHRVSPGSRTHSPAA